MTLELKKFDMKNISFKATETSGPVIVLIGRRDTGKSYLVCRSRRPADPGTSAVRG